MSKKGTYVVNHDQKMERMESFEREGGGGEVAGIEPIPECSFKNVTVIMTRGMENAFFRWGYRIAHYPWPTILASLALCAVCSGGLYFWNPVTDDEVLWTPYGSEVSEGTDRAGRSGSDLGTNSNVAVSGRQRLDSGELPDRRADRAGADHG